MKKTLGYAELWKQKQRELSVKGNPDAEWLKMRAVLDQRLPLSGAIKKPSHFKLPKWGLKVLVGVSTAAAVYVGSRLYLSKTHHDAAKPATQQVHRDTLFPAANGTSQAGNSEKPATRGSASGVTPVIHGVDSRIIVKTTPKPEQQPIDSIEQPAILNIPVHRDSALLPAEAAPLRPRRDSISPVELDKKVIQKDTSNKNKNTPKKKRRPKVSVFF